MSDELGALTVKLLQELSQGRLRNFFENYISQICNENETLIE